METFYGIAKYIPVTFGEPEAKTDFLVVERVPGFVLIWIPEIEKLNTHIDLGDQYVDFTIGRKAIWVGLEPERTIDQMQGDELEEEDFMIVFSTTLSVEVSEDQAKKI